MCLSVHSDYPVPADGSIRYKIVILSQEKGRYGSPFLQGYDNDRLYALNETTKKDPSLEKDINAKGFHVFVHQKDAQQEMWDSDIILEVSCHGFVAGGCWSDPPNHLQEIWAEVTPLREVKNEDQ